MFIDTHAHLHFPDYHATEIPEILSRAHAAHVSQLINVGTNMETSYASMTLAESFSEIFSAVGIHPHDAIKIEDETAHTFFTMAQHPRVVAIGEIGLDYYRLSYDPDQQQQMFRTFLSLAKSVNLPYIIHQREAEQDVINLIQEADYFKGVFHCFSGDVSFATRVLDMGLSLSFTGIVTFKNADLLRQVVTQVPLSRLLLETDCPFLSPAPYRSKRNEPARLAVIAQMIADIKHISLEEVEQITTDNASALFGLV